MVSINESHMNDRNVLYIKAAGLSTDTKPSNVATGSIFTEVDTGKVFFFDEESDWVEQGAVESAEAVGE